ELNRILSDYLPESELNRLSATAGTGVEVPLSPSLATVLLAAQEIAGGSHGAFDATVGPVVQLWRRARRQRQLPDPARLETARAAVGWTHLVLTGRPGSPGGVRGRLLKPGMRLDLGGIAKGYALDEAARILREHGLRAFLVAGAGDLVAGDAPPGTRGWRVELPPLDAPDAPPSQFVLLHGAALCTSGDLFQHVEIDGRRYSHIVDPRTGVGLVDHSLVTVIGRTGMETDALATAASVLPPEAARRLCRRRRVEARIIRRPGNVVESQATPGFQGWLE
ncbi:MAG: FAD:protein FMN transferase, partial [Verrucomicrobiota bacterium]